MDFELPSPTLKSTPEHAEPVKKKRPPCKRKKKGANATNSPLLPTPNTQSAGLGCDSIQTHPQLQPQPQPTNTNTNTNDVATTYSTLQSTAQRTLEQKLESQGNLFKNAKDSITYTISTCNKSTIDNNEQKKDSLNLQNPSNKTSTRNQNVNAWSTVKTKPSQPATDLKNKTKPLPLKTSTQWATVGVKVDNKKESDILQKSFKATKIVKPHNNKTTANSWSSKVSSGSGGTLNSYNNSQSRNIANSDTAAPSTMRSYTTQSSSDWRNHKIIRQGSNMSSVSSPSSSSERKVWPSLGDFPPPHNASITNKPKLTGGATNVPQGAWGAKLAPGNKTKSASVNVWGK